MSLFDSASLVITPSGYKEGKLYSIKPTDGSGDLDVVRATTATRVNSEGLIEVFPRNLVSYSEQFDNAYWTKLTSDSTPAPVVTSNYATSPYGTQTAERVQLTLPSDNQYSIIKRAGLNPNATVGSTIYQSIYLKATDISQVGKKVDIYVYDTTNSSYRRIFNHVLTNDWERIESNNLISFGSTSTSVEYAFGKARANASGQAGTTGTITSEASTDFLVWGAQLEAGSAATSYFPTTDRLNIPRLDYSNGSCPSILVEPQRTNLLLRSEEFDNSAWLKVNTTVTANQDISPNGTLTADRLQINGGGFNYISRGIASLNTTVTSSVWVKANSVSNNTFRLYTDAITGTVFTATTEWQRINVTKSVINGEFRIAVPSSGDAVDILVWGAQLESGSNATSYIPTVASSVTRNADVISKTGISDLIGQTEGTLFVDANIDNFNSSRILEINDGSSNNRILLQIISNNRLNTVISQSGLLQSAISTTTLSNGKYKIAVSYLQNNISFFVNGILIGTDEIALIPICNQINFGSDFLGENVLSNRINSTIIFKTKLTDEECINLTTI